MLRKDLYTRIECAEAFDGDVFVDKLNWDPEASNSLNKKG